MEPVEEVEERDPTEAFRIALMVIGLALNIWIMWDYMKDRPETMVMRQRMKNWWSRYVTSPTRKDKAIRKAVGETIFEAIGIVEGHQNAGD